MLYPPPIPCQKLLDRHKSETDRPKQKKIIVLENIFLQLYTGFGVKIQNTSSRKS